MSGVSMAASTCFVLHILRVIGNRRDYFCTCRAYGGMTSLVPCQKLCKNLFVTHNRLQSFAI